MKKTQRVMPLVLFVLCLFSFPFQRVGAQSDERDFTYESRQDGTVIILQYRYRASEREVVVPDRLDGLPVTAIAGRAFASCGNLESIILPAGLVEIGSAAFMKCDNLLRMDIPPGVRVLGSEAFSQCGNLREVTFPESLVEIGSLPFQFCFALESITAAPGNTAFESIDGVLIDKASQAILQYPINRPGAAYAVPEGIKGVMAGAFNWSKHLAQINLPGSLEWVGEFAFSNCLSLAGVAFGDGVSSIAQGAFSNCGLEEVILPPSLRRLNDRVFADNYALRLVSVPESVVSITGSAFDGCPQLELRVKAGSYAEAYARENSLPYMVISP